MEKVSVELTPRQLRMLEVAIEHYSDAYLHGVVVGDPFSYASYVSLNEYLYKKRCSVEDF